MLRTFLAVAVGLALVSGSQAQVVYVSIDRSSTVGLPGYYTSVVKVSTVAEEYIVGFDFASQPNYGFFGTFNQVNPGGLPTIFQDNNSSFAAIGADVSQDSQFLYSGSNTIVIPDGFASESSSSLRAMFASVASLGRRDVPIAQLVVPNFELVWFVGTVYAYTRSGDFVELPVQGYWGPEPATASLLGMACIGLVGMRRCRK